MSDTPEGHTVEIRYPATAVDTLQARRAANPVTREKGKPEFYAGPTEYEDHEERGKRFVCRDCEEVFDSREEAREHTRETFPGYTESDQ